MSISQDERERAIFRSRRKFRTDLQSDLATLVSSVLGCKGNVLLFDIHCVIIREKGGMLNGIKDSKCFSSCGA